MAKLTEAMLDQIKREAEGIEYGQIVVKLNASSSSVDISVTRDVRILKDDPEFSKPGRLVLHSQRREG